MEEINEFDDFIKKGLDQLGTDLPANDWSDFSEKLSAQELPLDDTPTSFDDLIRQQMGDLQVDSEANHWNSLESKIDAELNVPEISDEALDQLVIDEVQHLYIPYNPAHWTLMSNRLEEEFSVRRKIVKYKIAEVSLMLVLLFTILPYLPDYSVVDKTEKPTASIHYNTITEIVENTSIADEKLTQGTKEIPTPLIASTTHSVPEKNIVIEQTSGVSLGENPVNINNATAKVNLQSIAEVVVPTTKTIVTLPISSAIATSQKEIEASITPTPISILPKEKEVNSQPALVVATLPQAETSLLEGNADWGNIGVFKKFKRSVIVKIGAVSSLDINKVKTPSTGRYKNNGYDQHRLGYGGGIVLDLTYEKLTFSSGLIYRRINYTPEEMVNIGGTFISGYQSHVFDAVNLNLLTIPMNFQFQMSNPGQKWKWYALTGASLNVLALNHYNVTVNNLGNTLAPSAIPIPQSPGANPEELYQENEVANEGLFEGGSFQRNHYFTTNFGLGVERFISPRWSLFIQPVYQFEVFDKNLGPNNDRIHTFSVQIGAKSSFR